MTKAQLKQSLALAQYPRSAQYDPEWVMRNLMGPNVLWLTEALTQRMDLKPGMRVLDMGCGKAVSSIFLAKEFSVQVWANDLWIDATQNWSRIQEAGMDERVFPIHAEAHALPYADGFFDAIVSMDAYQYFGTDDLYIGTIARYLKPGGQLGIVVPGLTHELGAQPPEHLQPYWEWDFGCFHSPDWWRMLWQRSGKVRVESADLLPEGWREWLHWLEVCADAYPGAPGQAEMLRIDAGRTLGFSRIVARKS